MKVSWKWLQDWIDLDDLDPDEVIGQLTMAGLEVDGVERLGQGCETVVVARIDRIRNHPNADRLVVCEVDDGRSRLNQVVCGAANMAEGDLVALARPGSHPPGVDFEIVARQMRGEMSSGMLCSAAELELSDDADGLMILDAHLEVGRPIFEALGLDDTIIEFDLTPNRPDCLGHLGVARELAAMYDRPLKRPGFGDESRPWESADGPAAADAAGLTVDDSDGCPRYLFAVVDGIDVGPSPPWLQARLAAVGLRSVNNIVDVTNYVLLELNQPLHAFDLDQLTGPEIRVRRADDGEELTGIDHQTYQLDPRDLVIADSQRPIALAGVMGGAPTEVSDETTRVLIECGLFDPVSIRQSAKRHQLHTDSSHRFERGIDPAGLAAGLARAVELIMDTQSSAQLRAGIAEHRVDGVCEPATTTLDRALTSRVLGADVSDSQIVDHLEALDVRVDEQGDGWHCQMPTYRPDLTRPIDLVEEVARLVGYDQIPSTLPQAPMGSAHQRRPDADQGPTITPRADRDAFQKIRTQLLSFGLYEVINYGFMSPRDLDQLRVPDDDRRRDTVGLANPLVAADRYMQTTLAPGLLENLQTNLAHRTDDVALFEYGRRYFPDQERSTLGLLLSGRQFEHWSGSKTWDFYDLKGIIEAICRPFATGALRWEVPAEPQPHLHPGIQARWGSDRHPVSRAGRLHPAVAADLDIAQDVLVAEVYLDELLELGRTEVRPASPSPYPAVTHDFALVYDVNAEYARLDQAILDLADQHQEFGEVFESHEIFDVYSGQQVAEGKRSLALSVVYRSPTETLTDEDVEQADQLLVDWLADQVGACLR